MRRVKVEITSDNPEDKGPATFTLERDRGAGPTEEDKKVVPFDNLPKGTVFTMEEDQRLIVEPYAKEAVAYSPDQYAAYKVADQEKPGEIDSPDEKPTPEMKKVDELERKRYEKDTGQKMPEPGQPTPIGGLPPGQQRRDTSSGDVLVDANMAKGRETPRGPLPDHPSPPQPNEEERKREKQEQEKRNQENAKEAQRLEEERRKREEAARTKR